MMRKALFAALLLVGCTQVRAQDITVKQLAHMCQPMRKDAAQRTKAEVESLTRCTITVDAWRYMLDHAAVRVRERKLDADGVELNGFRWWLNPAATTRQMVLCFLDYAQYWHVAPDKEALDAFLMANFEGSNVQMGQYVPSIWWEPQERLPR
jgi:hypothetical protein